MTRGSGHARISVTSTSNSRSGLKFSGEGTIPFSVRTFAISSPPRMSPGWHVFTTSIRSGSTPTRRRER